MHARAIAIAHEIDPRRAARDLSTLDRIDYEDCLLVSLPPDDGHTPEEWAREMIEGASESMRTQLVLGWRMIGLRNGPADDPDRILGWEIRRNEHDVVLLGARSWIGMSGELLFKREPDGILFATFISQGNPAAKLLWAPIGPNHRRITSELLTKAAARLGEPESAAIPVAV